MNRNKKAFKELNALAKADPGNWKKEVHERKEKKAWLRTSQKIAFKILRALRAQKKTQRELASIMDVSPQQVNKWVKGKENFTLDTLCRLEEALSLKLLALDSKDLPEKEGVLFYSPPSAEISHKTHESDVFDEVSAYLNSKRLERKVDILYSKIGNLGIQSSGIERDEIGFDFSKHYLELDNKISSIWSSFNDSKEDEQVIQLKPENEYNRKLDLNQLMVAEPDNEKY